MEMNLLLDMNLIKAFDMDLKLMLKRNDILVSQVRLMQFIVGLIISFEVKSLHRCKISHLNSNLT